MFNKFKISINNRNHWQEHNLKYDKDKFRICTYLHYYNNEKYPFYIGQGTIERAFNFKRQYRTKAWNNKVKDINLIDVVFYKIDISISDSLKYEKELISKYEEFNTLTNCKVCTKENYKYNVTDNVNKHEIAIFDMYGNYIKTFENINKAAKEYNTSVSIINKRIKDKSYYKGFFWKRI